MSAELPLFRAPFGPHSVVEAVRPGAYAGGITSPKRGIGLQRAGSEDICADGDATLTIAAQGLASACFAQDWTFVRGLNRYGSWVDQNEVGEGTTLLGATGHWSRGADGMLDVVLQPDPRGCGADTATSVDPSLGALGLRCVRLGVGRGLVEPVVACTLRGRTPRALSLLFPDIAESDPQRWLVLAGADQVVRRDTDEPDEWFHPTLHGNYRLDTTIDPTGEYVGEGRFSIQPRRKPFVPRTWRHRRDCGESP